MPFCLDTLRLALRFELACHCFIAVTSTGFFTTTCYSSDASKTIGLFDRIAVRIKFDEDAFFIKFLRRLLLNILCASHAHKRTIVVGFSAKMRRVNSARSAIGFL